MQIVETTNGPVSGGSDAGARWWRGIPYGAPPTGAMRWRAPQPPDRWIEPMDATAPGIASLQPISPIMTFPDGQHFGEDCLRVDVWAPAGDSTAPLPVMVWIHGGAYVFGGPGQSLFDGHALVSQGVVIVSVGYRVGALGFLDLTGHSTATRIYESNVALRDVIAGLEWVRDNVAAFGGDPSNVTLFGESAGAGIVTTLMTSPAALGLFHRAIAESSPATSVYAHARADVVTSMVLAELGSDGSDLDTMRSDRLVDAGAAIYARVPVESPGVLAFAPTVDGDIVPEHPMDAFAAGRQHPVPLVIGTNKDETALFLLVKSPLMPVSGEALRAMGAAIRSERPDDALPTDSAISEAYAKVRRRQRGPAVSRDLAFRMPAVWIAEAHSAIAPTYLYRFDWATPSLKVLGIGATHGTELPYVWGNLPSGGKDITFKLGGRRAGERVSKRLLGRWSGFAKSGAPDAAGTPPWASYDAAARASLVIDASDSIQHDLDAELRATWGADPIGFR